MSMRQKVCDRCGRVIEAGELRYVAKLQVYAAYDPLNISFDDLMKDHRRDIEQLLARCEGMTEEELMRDVYVQFEFDLCRACQRIVVESPLPKAGQ